MPKYVIQKSLANELESLKVAQFSPFYNSNVVVQWDKPKLHNDISGKIIKTL